MTKKLGFRSIMVALLALGLSIVAMSQTNQKSDQAGGQRTVKIGILPFADASGSGNRTVADGIGRFVRSEITHTCPNLVARFIALNGSTISENLDEEKAVDLGKASRVDVVLLGTVLEAKSQESTKGGWLPSIRGQSGSLRLRSIKANVIVQADLYRVSTGQRITSLRVNGSHSDNKFGGTVYTTLGSWDGGSNGAFMDSPLGKALQDVVNKLVKEVAERI
jgi:hypothetical protein